MSGISAGTRFDILRIFFASGEYDLPAPDLRGTSSRLIIPRLRDEKTQLTVAPSRCAACYTSTQDLVSPYFPATLPQQSMTHSARNQVCYRLLKFPFALQPENMSYTTRRLCSGILVSSYFPSTTSRENNDLLGSGSPTPFFLTYFFSVPPRENMSHSVIMIQKPLFIILFFGYVSIKY